MTPVLSSLRISFSLLTPAAAQADTYAAPTAPTGVLVKVVDDGVKVSWSPAVGANPAVTHYVVHVGPGSCPVTVDAKTAMAHLLAQARAPYRAMGRAMLVPGMRHALDALGPVMYRNRHRLPGATPPCEVRPAA